MESKVTTHIEGSRKQRVHQLYDEQGAEAATVLGLKLKLSPNTVRSWIGTWRRDAEGPKPEVKKVAKGSPPEATPIRQAAKSTKPKVRKPKQAGPEAGEGTEAPATA